ncbi:hypothetical protein KC343_g10937 [Hortaea werneckii]|nr:hypothetical protein KC338_g395 [Hortaea werneckii]KAI7173779.1 hypothetical protein KC352_g24543 [Hortaea werneckii]KAI7551028.1 hypothetical protein KC317_g14106 [Hortaea werneckii]KAI7613319.1 hypothetical protein KC343_g10937 [Hortaea werneckii]KAI7625031.1 hypothetical protein KC346_g1924 [Hortaea werneckii]
MVRTSRRLGGGAPEYTGLPPPRKRARTGRAAQGRGQVQQDDPAPQAPPADPVPAPEPVPEPEPEPVPEPEFIVQPGHGSPADSPPVEQEEQTQPEPTSAGEIATRSDIARGSSPAVSATQETHQAVEQQDQEAPIAVSQATQTDPEALPANNIAHYESIDETPLKDKAGYLKTKLRIETDPSSQHRLGYNATFFVVPSADPSEVQEEQEQEVGYLLSWRVDKPTSTHPEAKQSWKDLLTFNIPRQPKTRRELAKCLQAIYDKKGVLRREFLAHEAQLTANSLLYLEMVYLDETVRGAGAFRAAMQGFETGLAALPEWFAFAGTVVLVPGMPIAHREAWEGERDDTKIEDELIGKYSTRGYEVWARKAEVRIRTGEVEEVCVMGKSVHLGAGA